MVETFKLDSWPRARGGVGRPAQPNEFEDLVRETYDAGEIQGVKVDTSEAKKTVAQIRQAAKRQGLGANVQVEENEDGTATVAFQGKNKRGSAA